VEERGLSRRKTTREQGVAQRQGEREGQRGRLIRQRKKLRRRRLRHLHYQVSGSIAHPLYYLLLPPPPIITSFDANKTELAPEEKTKILESNEFKEFIERSSRVVDRALYLSESLDIMEDYKTENKQEYAIFFDDFCCFYSWYLIILKKIK
jgi:hypothetical protein